MEVYLNEAAKDFEGVIGLYTAETSRYFNAQDFDEKGYQEYSTMTSMNNLLRNDEMMFVNKYVSKAHVNYYPFKWIDTSNIALFNFGYEIDNYRVNTQTPRVTHFSEQ